MTVPLLFIGVFHATCLNNMITVVPNQNVILPGMLIIVVSSMVASEVFKQKSVFLTILEAQGLNYQTNPITRSSDIMKECVKAFVTHEENLAEAAE